MNVLECITLLVQVGTNVQQLRADVLANAAAHSAALGAGASYDDVLAEMQACGEQYDRRIQWMEALLADQARRDKLAYALSPWPDAMVEVDRQAGEARALMGVWAQHPKATREDLLALCALVPQLVTRADMLWGQ